MSDMHEPELSLPKGVDPTVRPGPSVAMERLRAQMERTIAEQGRLDVEPEAANPLAILEVDPRSHPVQRFLEESAPGKDARRNLKNRVITVHRLLTGREGAVPWDDLYSYPWHMLTITDIERFRNALRDSHYKPASRNAFRAALRSLIHNCRRAGLISTHHEQLLTERIRLEKLDPERVGRAIPEHEVALIIEALAHRSPWRTARDRAMVVILATTGVRVSELCNMRLSDWNRSTGWITLNQTKNGNSHRVPVATAAVPYLELWLDQRGTEPGYLFTPLPSRLNSPMCMQVIKRALDRATAKAGLDHITAHDFRRTVATTLLRSHDPSTVMKLLNHKSLNSTLTYDRVGDDLQASAVDSLPIPAIGALPDEEVT